MRKVTLTAVALAAFLPVLVLSSGCEEELKQPDARKSRLIADENIRLSKEIQQLNRQLDKKIKLLEECSRKQAEVRKESDELTTSLMQAFGECKQENLRLQKENEALKAKIKQL
jgi:flagellar basal body-associated protein FliL